MVTAEKRDHLAATRCDEISRRTSLIADCCEALLNESDGVFREELKTSVKRIWQATEKILVLVEKVRVDVLRVDPLTAEEFRFRTACFVNDLKGQLTTILGFAQISLAGKLGPLSEKQREIMESIEKLGRSLAITSYELLELPA